MVTAGCNSYFYR